jgi:transcriptional regulator with XRE-family HTH domain
MLTKPRLLRLTKGLRQVDVVSLTEGRVTQPRLSMIERGIRPRPDEARALADVFGLEVPELFQTA